jgi:hypothetical protein
MRNHLLIPLFALLAACDLHSCQPGPCAIESCDESGIAVAIQESPTVLHLAAGETLEVTVYTKRAPDYDGPPITLSLRDLPDGVTGTLDPVVVTDGAPARLTLSAASDAPSTDGVVVFTVSGRSGSQTDSASKQLVVTGAPPTGPGSALLTVTRAGDGTVVSAPAGIDCGATCAARFSVGQRITLTARPARAGGSASFRGDCVAVEPGASIATLDLTRDATCAVVFEAAPPPPDFLLYLNSPPFQVTTSSRFTLRPEAYAAPDGFVAATAAFPDLVRCEWRSRLDNGPDTPLSTTSCDSLVVGAAPPTDIVPQAGVLTVTVVGVRAGGQRSAPASVSIQVRAN